MKGKQSSQDKSALWQLSTVLSLPVTYCVSQTLQKPKLICAFPEVFKRPIVFSSTKTYFIWLLGAFNGAMKSLIYSEKYTCISLQDHVVLLLLQHSETAFQITPRQIWLLFHIKVGSPINHSSV